jgi:hypothetical protein
MRLLIILVFVSLLSCEGKTETSDTCNEPVRFTSAVPIAIKYAEIDPSQTCLAPGIGDIKAKILKKANELCQSENCETGECKAENKTVIAIRRQHTTYSRIVNGKKECWIVVEVDYTSKCKCK